MRTKQRETQNEKLKPIDIPIFSALEASFGRPDKYDRGEWFAVPLYCASLVAVKCPGVASMSTI